jgi:hypothetical protein
MTIILLERCISSSGPGLVVPLILSKIFKEVGTLEDLLNVWHHPPKHLLGDVDGGDNGQQSMVGGCTRDGQRQWGNLEN